EVAPKNILMIGPTGVGKTEIARRLARLAQSPFLKVEASKFTEVGYVGRDVESMVRDLAEIAVNLVREERAVEVREKARTNAEARLLDLLPPPTPKSAPGFGASSTLDTRGDSEAAASGAPESGQRGPGWEAESDSQARTRERMRQQLRDGRLDT